MKKTDLFLVVAGRLFSSAESSTNISSQTLRLRNYGGDELHISSNGIGTMIVFEPSFEVSLIEEPGNIKVIRPDEDTLISINPEGKMNSSLVSDLSHEISSRVKSSFVFSDDIKDSSCSLEEAIEEVKALSAKVKESLEYSRENLGALSKELLDSMDDYNLKENYLVVAELIAMCDKKKSCSPLIYALSKASSDRSDSVSRWKGSFIHELVLPDMHKYFVDPKDIDSIVEHVYWKID